MEAMISTSNFTKAISRLPLQPPTTAATAARPVQAISDLPLGRRKLMCTSTSTLLTVSLSLALGLEVSTPPPPAMAQSWGTRSFLLERYFQPGLSPEESVARIRQSREGLHSMRHMLDTMSWRYVIFYIRLKAAYLSQDLKNAINTLPQGLRKEYINKANALVDNTTELDEYIRTPKVYESYLYYERTLQSIDELVGMLA